METETTGHQLTEERALELATADIADQYDLRQYQPTAQRISDYSVDVVFTRSMEEEVVEIRLNVFEVEPEDLKVREVMSLEKARQVAVRFHGQTVSYNFFRHNTQAKQRFLGIGVDGTYEHYSFAFPVFRVDKNGERIQSEDMRYSVIQVERYVNAQKIELAILTKQEMKDYFVIN